MTHVTLYFRLKDNDGNEYISGVTYQGLLAELSALRVKVAELTERILKLESGERQKKIVEILKEKPRTRGYIKRRVADADWFDFQLLLNQGIIEEVRVGKTYLYKLKEAEAK